MSGDWPFLKSTFKYEPLNLDRPAFRLLRLKSARDSQTTIQCEIILAYFDIENVPDYEAISYTWGAANSPRKIRLDGCDFYVRFNLWSVLRDVRRQDEDRMLWVDAICINQDDVRERGHQVQQIRYVYERAERVIFWLGQLTNPSIDILMDLLAELQRQTRGVSWSPTDPRWQSQWEQIPKGSLDNLRLAFEELLERPWFRRVWILQEVANASAGLVHCGHKSISAKVFTACPRLLEVEPNQHCQAVLDVMPGPYRGWSWWEQDRRLHTLLKKFSETEAARDHDRIFALFGLCPEANTRITVDYNKSMTQLLRETASYILQDNPSPYDIGSLPCFEYDSTKTFLKDIDALHNRVLEQLVQLEPAHVVDDFILRFQDQLIITPDLCVATMERKEVGNAVILSILDRNPQAPQMKDHQGRTPLTVAAEYEDEVLMRVLIENGADMKDIGNSFPLPTVSKQGNEVLFQLLLDQGTDWRSTAMGFKNPPIIIACQEGYEIIVRLLLDRGSLITNEVLKEAYWIRHEHIMPLLLDRGALITNEALEAVCRIGHEGLVRLLLDRGAPITNEALEEAYRTGHEGLIRLLLDRGAPITNEALVAVCRRGHEGLVRLLLDRGAPITNEAFEAVCGMGHKGLVRLLLDRGAPITNAPITNKALEEACRIGHEGLVRLLLDRGSLITNEVLKEAYWIRHEHIMPLLLDRGALITNEALEAVCRIGHEGLIRLLLDRGAPITNEALEEACRTGHEGLIRLLLDRGAPITNEALVAVCRRGHEGLVRLLLDRGAPITNEALEEACRRGHDVIIRLLLGLSATPEADFLSRWLMNGYRAVVRIFLGPNRLVDSLDVNGQTPLFLASKGGHENVVRTLLDAGADCNRQDTFGVSSLGYALRRKHEGVAQLLRSRGATESGL